MTTEIVKVDKQNVETYAGLFGESLLARFAKFSGVAESSRRTYVKSIKQLLKYFAANNITSPTRENLIDWKNSLIAQGKSPYTTQLYLTACKVFFRWLALENVYHNVADNLKLSKSEKPDTTEHARDSLDEKQCATLVNGVQCVYKRRVQNVGNKRQYKTEHNTLKELRDTAVLALLVSTGLRTIEVVRADVGDLIMERGKWFLKVQGKGKSEKKARVLVPTQVYAKIVAYLKARGTAKTTDALFVSTSRRNKNARLETQTISRMVKANLRGIGLDSPRLTAHSLRHATATNAINAGVELANVQMILRHKSISTTTIYAHAWERMKNNGEQVLADSIFGTAAFGL